MPLKLVGPRKGKSPNYTIRGSYLGVAVNKSSGTDKRSVARTILARLEQAIESGEYPPKQVASRGERTFLKAAVEYMEAGRRPRYVARLIKHFGATPIAEIDQAAIDAAAIELFPNATAGTRNACVYTPVSAILHHAGVDLKFTATKGGERAHRHRLATSRGRPRNYPSRRRHRGRIRCAAPLSAVHRTTAR